MLLQLHKMQLQANSICQKTYSCGNVQVTLGQYNADAEQFPINIQTHFLGQPLTKNTQFKIARAQARQLKENWDQVEFLAQVKLKTRIGSPPPRRGQGRALLSDRCRLAEVALRDKASNNYYALDLLADDLVGQIAKQNQEDIDNKLEILSQMEVLAKKECTQLNDPPWAMTEGSFFGRRLNLRGK